MATKKNNTTSKKNNSKQKQAQKSNKFKLSLFIIVLIVIMCVVIFVAINFDTISERLGIKNSNDNATTTTTTLTTTTAPSTTTAATSTTTTAATSTTTSHDEEEHGIKENILYDDFQIHFMQLGNSNAGDSVYIKAGDVDILVDAGSSSGSFSTTSSYINQYCTDNTLEYVIATHGDEDHIAAFPKFAESYKFGTIIMNQYTNKTTKTYANMKSSFESEVTNNNAQIVYAGDCFNNTNGGKRVYQLTENVSMTIIYNEFYFKTNTDENNYSVCTLFTYDDGNYEHNFLLTGDLEKKGEESLAAYYDESSDERTLPHCELFKAGHHGSKTSSNECLLKLITPEICVVSCCAGTAEYTTNYKNQFPTQEFIDRIAKYTDRVYVTSMIDLINGQYEYVAMNGNVCISTHSDVVGIYASNNYIKLKDTGWFNADIYVINENNVKSVKKTDFYTSETEGAVAVKRRTLPSYWQ